RRRTWIRSLLRALTDPRTFDVRRNPSLLLGAALAIPIPILSFSAGVPPWMSLLALLAPAAWGLVLGAAGRVAWLEREDALRHEARAELATREALIERKLRDQLESEKKLITAEMKLAQAIQRTLIPHDLLRPDLQVVVRHVPSSWVGGDYILVDSPKPDVVHICIADVSGHGVAAGMVVSRIHGVVRRLALQDRNPVQMIDEVNRRAMEILKDTYFFLTFAAFRIDLTKRRIDYATAGHPAQLLLRAGGTVESLSTPNRLLGMDADVFDSERPMDSTTFEPGDSLVLFTDGLFEIPGKEDGEILGEDGLRRVLENLGGLPPALVAGDILQDLSDFQGASKFEDDVSLIVARLEPVASSPTAPVSTERTGVAASAATGC
ncbi:MAG TPA: PP2C family protein-serine/threonine phosphatase, partial [Planctomycetota bacterium]|nr:PP2C family protein-serine/threonine phosphatase [Planctomycetota bacterium]